MNLTLLRKRLGARVMNFDTTIVRGERVNRFGHVKLTEKVLAPVSRYFTNEKARDNWFDYSNSELWLYHTGNCRAEQWTQLAKIWYKLYGVRDPNTIVHSAYGHIFKPGGPNLTQSSTQCDSESSQWTRARDQLLKDPNTRRAFVQFLLPEFSSDSTDVPCSVIATFRKSNRDRSIENADDDHGVDVIYFMRSSDILYGLLHDIVWAKSLSIRMQMSLAKAKGAVTYKLSKTSRVIFITSDLHEYLSHPVPTTGLRHTFSMDYVVEMLDYIVFN